MDAYDYGLKDMSMRTHNVDQVRELNPDFTAQLDLAALGMRNVGLDPNNADGSLNEVFTFIPGDGSDTLHFLVALARAFGVKAGNRYLQVLTFPGGPEHHRSLLLAMNDVSPQHAARIPPSKRWQPPLFALQDDGTVILFDGSHRLWLQLGDLIDGKVQGLIGYIFPIQDLRTMGVVLTNIPADVNFRHHGVYDREAHRARAATAHVEFNRATVVKGS